MKSINFKLFIIIGVLFAVSISFLIAEGNSSFPGIPDPSPNGCIDCHNNKGSNDTGMNKVLDKIDDHPSVGNIIKKLPDDCRMCHKPDSNGGPLMYVLHKAHFSNPAQNSFISEFKGQCLSCHSLNPSTYIMGIKSTNKNW